MKIRPIGNYVLVKVLPPDQKTQGGLYLPDAAQSNHPTTLVIRAEVVAAGPGYREFPRPTGTDESRVPPDVKVGDQVLFPKPFDYSRLEIMIDGASHLLIGAEFIAGVVEG